MSSEMSGQQDGRLNELLAAAGLVSLQTEQYKQFTSYLSLILHWNARINLTAVRDEAGILSRHFVESIACAQALPPEVATLLDFGSGAGFPGIPIAICHPEIAVTLAESQGKKAAFLQEAARVLNLSCKVFSGRAETLRDSFDCVTLRAVDRMEMAVQSAVQLVRCGGRLALMTSREELAALRAVAGSGFSWSNSIALPNAENRVLALGKRLSSPA
jgi:16S rRNA (guanine527-N7)-methyltransferase